MIADAGDGRLYMVEDIGALPKIFMKETQEAQKSQLVEDLIHVRVAKKVEAIEGTNVENAPPLHGYVTTKPKPTSETILISDLGEPILARWRYGAGTSVAWTSDVKNRWARRLDPLGRLSEVLGAGRSARRCAARSTTATTCSRRSPTAARRSPSTRSTPATSSSTSSTPSSRSSIRRPTRSPQTMPMAQTAAGRYTADFRIQKYGSYLLKAVHKRDGKTVAESLGSVALSYPLEYLRTTPDPEPLRHAAQVSGGHDQAKPARDLGRRATRRSATRRTCGRACCSASSACSSSTSTRSASACSATGRSSSTDLNLGLETRGRTVTDRNFFFKKKKKKKKTRRPLRLPHRHVPVAVQRFSSSARTRRHDSDAADSARSCFRGGRLGTISAVAPRCRGTTMSNKSDMERPLTKREAQTIFATKPGASRRRE